LVPDALGAAASRDLRPTAVLAVVGGITFEQSLLLFRCQFDVANPQADRRLRYADAARDLVDRGALLTP
jgi:hypothetical protein